MIDLVIGHVQDGDGRVVEHVGTNEPDEVVLESELGQRRPAGERVGVETGQFVARDVEKLKEWQAGAADQLSRHSQVKR